MYQKQEIIVKKNAELLKRYEDCREKSYEMDEDEAYEFFKNNISDAERELIEKTYAAKDFISVEVAYYTDLLNLLSQFTYKSSPSMIYGYEDNNRPYASCKIDRNETDDEIHIVIEEYWNNRFELYATNPLFDNGFSLKVDYEEVPKIVRLLYNATQRHKYLQNQYAEKHEEFGDCLSYNCISRYFDECRNGEGAIGVFDNDENEYKMYGYGMADYGWGAEPMTENLVDKSILLDNPDKIWYPINPQIMWFYLYEETIYPVFDDAVESVCKNEKDAEWAKSFLEKIYIHDDFLDEIGDSYFHDIEVHNLESAYYLWDEDVYDGTSEQAELMERCNAKLTSREVLLLLETIEKANKLHVERQKKALEEIVPNYADYLNDMFFTRLLFCSDENEILYAEADSSVENGVKTGDMVMHYKKF